MTICSSDAECSTAQLMMPYLGRNYKQWRCSSRSKAWRESKSVVERSSQDSWRPSSGLNSSCSRVRTLPKFLSSFYCFPELRPEAKYGRSSPNHEQFPPRSEAGLRSRTSEICFNEFWLSAPSLNLVSGFVFCVSCNLLHLAPEHWPSPTSNTISAYLPKHYHKMNCLAVLH